MQNTETKFTRGKWEAIKLSATEISIIANMDMKQTKCDVFTQKTRDIAIMENVPEVEANAALICSAVNNTSVRGINPEAVPDMLEALERIIESLKEGATLAHSDVVFARAAITKATYNK